MAESQYTPLTQAGGSQAASYNMVPGLAGAGWSNIASGSFPSTNTTGMPTLQGKTLLSSVEPQTGSFMQGLNDTIGNIFGIGENNKFGSFLDTNINGMTMGDYAKLPAAQQMGIMNAFNLNQMDQGPGLLDIAGSIMQGVNMFKQWSAQDKYMDMMREQLGMAKEQWNMTKDEVNRINAVRNNLNQGYQSGNYGASPTSNTNY